MTSIRILGWVCVVAIAVLSLVPGDTRPYIISSGRTEHFMAYAGAGFFFAWGYCGLRERLLAWVGLSIASCLFEILQNFVPGRTLSALDALASTSGLTFGLLSGVFLVAAVRP